MLSTNVEGGRVMRAMAGVNRRRRWRGSALAATAGLMMLTPVLGACGGGASGDSPEVASIDDGEGPDDDATDDSTDDTTATSVDFEEAMLAYTECMRDEGIDMPDPTKNADGGTEMAVDLNEVAPDKETFDKAEEKCSPLLEDAVTDMTIDPEQEAEMRKQMLDYAECMRDHGIDMPDPTFSTDGGRMVITQEAAGGEEGPPASSGDGEDGSDGSTPPADGDGRPEMDPEFEAADEECTEEVGMDVGKPGGRRTQVNSSEDD
jgi:hypothetical protein